MQAFNAAIRIVLKHPVYLIVYILFLSLMGIFIASSITSDKESSEFTSVDTPLAVIDRDDSELSSALTSFLQENGALIDVADDEFALQDAVATGEVMYLLIIPEGYENDFLLAAHEGAEGPALETTYSFATIAGSLVDQQVNQYLGLVRAAALLEPEEPIAGVIDQANGAIKESITVDTLQTPGGLSPADPFAFYLQWGTYTMTASIVVCVGTLMSAFNRTDVRRRNAVSPMTSLSLGIQKAAGCLLVTIVVWAVTCAMGLIAFGSSMAEVPLANTLLMLAAAFVFSLIPLSLGFLLGQLGIGETAANAVGNITGMVMSFLGGAWISFDLLPASVQIIARFVPTYWYTDVVKTAAHLEDANLSSILPLLPNFGIIALFAVMLFAVALVVGRLRLRSAEAGGNAAASVLAT